MEISDVSKTAQHGETLTKHLGSDNGCSVPVSREEYQPVERAAGWVVCGACARTFRPDFAAQRFCDHECYAASLRVAIGQRFWSKVNKSSIPDECWLWTAATIGGGYGQIMGVVNGKRRPVYAHRVSWEMAFGPIPADLYVLHRCDVPLCVNPDHLFLGTQGDNLADARAKGRLLTRAYYQERGRRRQHALQSSAPPAQQADSRLDIPSGAAQHTIRREVA